MAPAKPLHQPRHYDADNNHVGSRLDRSAVGVRDNAEAGNRADKRGDVDNQQTSTAMRKIHNPGVSRQFILRGVTPAILSVCRRLR